MRKPKKGAKPEPVSPPPVSPPPPPPVSPPPPYVPPYIPAPPAPPSGNSIGGVALGPAQVCGPADIDGWKSVWWYRDQNGNGCALNHQWEWNLNRAFAPTAHVRAAEVVGDEFRINVMPAPADIQPLLGYDTADAPQQTIGNVRAISEIRHSAGILEARDGYWEVVCRLPPATFGMWGAPLWIMPAPIFNPAKGYFEGVWPPEIDTGEFVNVPTVLHTTIHDVSLPGHSRGAPHYGIDWSDGFHRLGQLVTPDWFIWFADGVEVYREPQTEATRAVQNWYAITNLAFGGEWPCGRDAAGNDIPPDFAALPITMGVRSISYSPLA